MQWREWREWKPLLLQAARHRWYHCIECRSYMIRRGVRVQLLEFWYDISHEKKRPFFHDKTGSLFSKSDFLNQQAKSFDFQTCQMKLKSWTSVLLKSEECSFRSLKGCSFRSLKECNFRSPNESLMTCSWIRKNVGWIAAFDPWKCSCRSLKSAAVDPWRVQLSIPVECSFRSRRVQL